MDDLRPDALATVAARVVAWHNRHPLARRITAAQVQSVGYVALPFLAPAEKPAAASAGKPAAVPDTAAAPAAQAAADPGKSLRERALERAQAQPAAAPQATPPPAAKVAATKAVKPAPLQAAFSEDFIAPLAVGRVARWAAEHGAPAARPPRDGPLREVAVDRSLAGPRSELLTLYALTAMVEVRGKRVRMLLGAGSGSNAVIGKRLWSTPRLAIGSSLLGSGAAAAALSYVLMPAPPAPAVATPPPPGPQAMAPAASIPSIRPPALRASAAAEMATLQAVLAASSPQPVASGSAPHAPEVAAHAGATPAPAAAVVAKAATTASGAAPRAPSAAVSGAASATAAPSAPPVDVEPTLGRIVLPPLGLPKGDGSAAALQARRQAALATAGLPGAVLAPPTHASASAQSAASDAGHPAAAARPGRAPPAQAPNDKTAAAASSPGPAAMASAPARVAAAPKAPSNFAVSSRLLRTRAEAEQTQSAMRALLAAAGQTAAHVELVPAGEDWRVVGWPFAQRAQADSASKLLAARGMRVTVIDF